MGPIITIFQSFSFCQYRPGKCLLWYSRTKIYAFLTFKNKKIKKAKNWHFWKGVNSWLWSKNGRFSNFFFLGNRAQENVFYDILEQKNAFLGHKNKKFKKELLPRKAFFRFRISKKTFSLPIFPKKTSWKTCHFYTTTIS